MEFKGFFIDENMFLIEAETSLISDLPTSLILKLEFEAVSDVMVIGWSVYKDGSKFAQNFTQNWRILKRGDSYSLNLTLVK